MMKVIYNVCNQERVLLNVVKISYDERGLYAWEYNADPSAFVFISHEISYSIVLDSFLEIDKFKVLGKIDCCESLISDIDDTIDDYYGTLNAGLSSSPDNLMIRINELKSFNESLKDLLENYKFLLEE